MICNTAAYCILRTNVRYERQVFVNYPGAETDSIRIFKNLRKIDTETLIIKSDDFKICCYAYVEHLNFFFLLK